MKILLVEDNLHLNDGYRKMLEYLGHSVETAFDGKPALDKMQEFRPDLVLLDLLMPKMGGVEFIKSWRQRNNADDVEIVLLTNLSYHRDVDTALKLGASEYCLKADLDPSGFARLIKKYETAK